MPESNAVPGFAPSTHGLRFANRWEPGPTIRFGVVDPRILGIGDARSGLCGGMAWLVREWFEAGRPIPADTVNPANGSPLYRVIVRRQVRSLDWMRVPLRFWLAARMDPARLAERTLDDVVPRLRASIDAGRLPMVGLIRHHGWNPMDLDRDHQVLAYAYATDPARGSTTFRLYDPNHPGRDDISLTVSPTAFGQSTGEVLLGLISL